MPFSILTVLRLSPLKRPLNRAGNGKYAAYGSIGASSVEILNVRSSGSMEARPSTRNSSAARQPRGDPQGAGRGPPHGRPEQAPGGDGEVTHREHGGGRHGLVVEGRGAVLEGEPIERHAPGRRRGGSGSRRAARRRRGRRRGEGLDGRRGRAGSARRFCRIEQAHRVQGAIRVAGDPRVDPVDLEGSQRHLARHQVGLRDPERQLGAA